MTRSSKKGPHVTVKVIKKIEKRKPSDGVINVWARECTISPQMVGYTFGVHNGKSHIAVLVTEEMIGHRLGEFSPSKTFRRHGGKMQKEQEAAKKASEIASAQAAKAATSTTAPGKK
ncbi:MAG: 30S ribosomal protein S19 [Alphaproteobacteria bacterium]|nr:30S ribosomal protein S19 [Alphaproteobacteria bacterium]